MSKVFHRAVLATALAVTLAGAATAQDEPVTPEGTTWQLTAYADDATASVPFYVQATLLLQDGSATGSSGCNTFQGAYRIDGDMLAFDEQLAVTRMACADESVARVEEAYLSALPRVASWSIEGQELLLDDADGSRLLAYEQPALTLTRSAMSQIVGLIADQDARIADQQARIDQVGERIDNVRIGTLRDRIKALETEVTRLRSQTASPAKRSGSGSAFNTAEKVLLKAIPQKVEKTCKPLRSGLPAGTVAAVACDGSRRVVAEQAYYLMEWSDAVSTMRSVANSQGVPNRRPRCHNQRAGWIDYGTNLGSEACWSDNGKANYRLITRATACKQLNVDGRRLEQPAIYLAMEGANDKMEPVRAAGLAYTDAGFLIMNFEAGKEIPAKNQPDSPGCKARIAQAGGL